MTEFLISESHFFSGSFLIEKLTQLSFLSFFAVFLWKFFRKPKPSKVVLTYEEEEELINNFQPEQLAAAPCEQKSYRTRLVQSRAGKRVIVDNKDCLNLATHNYLGYVDDKEVLERSADSIRKYGVGSCGPRGFYGTADVHLELEDLLAEFLGVEEACVYSYGFVTAASVIPAYSKKRDVIFADESINFSIQKGIDASRSKVRYFKHNDTVHLEMLLKEQDEIDKNISSRSRVRRFLIVEGIYAKTGNICPLPELVYLRKKYQLRMILDESISIGAVGKTGRGVVEHFQIPKEEVDITIGSMEGSLASVGGFCCGTSFIVEHQRLNASGYCFSASLPPLLAVAALTSLYHIKSDPSRITSLHLVSEKLHTLLSDLPGLVLSGYKQSPVKHLYVRETRTFRIDLEKLDRLSEYCFERGLAIVTPATLEHVERFPPRASLRVVVNALLDDQDIQFVLQILSEGCKNIFH